jgi:triacylglycerol esterase/lipase EstA (alpha/beta hydrolase family)
MEKCNGSLGLILFVHGLAGSRLGTWGNMLKVISSDESFREYNYDCYSFPTSLFRLPFSGRRAGVRELSEGLDTYINTYHREQENILLVGHSLGGIVARFYVLDQVRLKRASAIKGIALYAVPNTGAGIAEIANAVSWRHGHLRQLCRGSDILEELNVEWIREKVENYVQAVYIVGSADAIVSRESGLAYIGGKNTRTIVEHGHRSIVKPNSKNDIRYKVLKDFALSVFQKKAVCDEKINQVANQQDSKLNDPLFDVYSAAVEKFYLVRKPDNILKAAVSSSHLWKH